MCWDLHRGSIGPVEGGRGLGFFAASCALALSGNLGHAQLTEQAKVVASDAAASDRFGYSVAIDDDTAVLGAYQDDHVGTNAGSAYVFVRSGTGWSEQAKLTASDAAAHDWFGFGVTISGDTAVVGAPEDDHSSPNAGSAYVFVRDGTNWTEQAKLTADDADTDDEFGAAVSVSGDTVVVGSLRDDHGGGTNAGSAYVFVRTGTSWSQQAKLTASDGASEDLFCLCVLSEDGNTVVVSAFRDDHAGGLGAGSAYVFVRSGASWSEQAKLTSSDAAAGDEFGQWMGLSGDTALIGAWTDDHGGGIDAGSAYVFVRTGTSWSEQAKLIASDAAAGDQFGIGVSISEDRAIVGAWSADLVAGADAGSAYLFERSGTSWSEQAKLTASDAATGDRFGTSVALSGDRAVVGAYLDDHPGTVNAGSAYVYCQNPATVFPFNGDGINVDVLSASPMILGGTWTASVALGHSHGTGGTLILRVRTDTINGKNFGTPIGRRRAEVLIEGPLFASIAGVHDGVTGSIPPQAIPSSLGLMPWSAQAVVIGGGFVDLSSAVFGVAGH